MMVRLEITGVLKKKIPNKSFYNLQIVSIVLTLVESIIVVKPTTSIAVMVLPNESPAPA